MGKGTSTSSQMQSSTLSPYDPAAGPMNGILGKLGSFAGNVGTDPTAGQTAGIDKVQSDASTLNPAIMGGSLGLLNGGGATANNGATLDNLAGYKTGMSAYTDPNYSTVNSPAVRAALDQVATDTTNSVNGSWAAAGRDGSPGNMQALGRGIAAAEAPIILDQANKDTATRTNALGSVYGAGNTTYGILNNNQNTANSNIAAGANLGGTAINNDNTALTAENQRTSLPLSTLQTLLSTISPVAATFGTQNGTANGTQTMSGIQQASMLMQGLGSLWPKAPISFGS